MKRNILIFISIFALTGCSAAERIAAIGEEPQMTQISNPTTQRGYQPVSLPMPAPEQVNIEKNSLWTHSRTTFFKDQRATNVGDIITVLVDIEDEAGMENETSRSRSNSEDADLNAFLGLESQLNKVLPEGTTGSDIIGLGSNSNSTGSGSIEREEEITVRLAALVTQILPNGNMVLHGRQEVRVNFEKRILQINGVIRPEDISVNNTISYDQIAEARIAYGGEGHLMDVQQPRYGQQLYDIIMPF